MKILQALDLFCPAAGGTADVMHRLSQALTDRGHEVTVYASNKDYDQKYVDALRGVRVRPFASWLNPGGFIIMPGVISAARSELHDYDVVHAHTTRGFLNMVLYFYTRRFGVPFIIDAHGSTLRRVNAGVKRLFDAAFGHRILRGATRVIAENRVGVEEYLSVGVPPEKIATIYPPLPVEDYQELPAGGAFAWSSASGTGLWYCISGAYPSRRGSISWRPGSQD